MALSPNIKDNVVEIFLVISNSIVDEPLDVNVGNWEWDCGTFPESRITIENIDTIEGLSGTLVEVEDGSDSDKNYDEFNDSDYELSDEDDRLYEDSVDDNTEWAGTLLSNTRVPSQTMYYNTVEGEDMVYEDEGHSTDSDDGFRSWDEEDGDNSLNKALVFKAIKGREEPIFGNGMIFRSRHQLAEAIRQHSILNRKEIRFLKNETTRVRAKCKTYEKDEEKIDCPWELSATDKGVANKTLQHLIPDLQILNQPTWTIISDKQKICFGNALKEILEPVYDLFCLWCTAAMDFGRFKRTLSFEPVKHSLAISELLTTMARWAPRRIVNIGPCLSAKAPNTLWTSLRPAKRGRWPIIGHPPPASGGALLLLVVFFLRRR
ncbi:hypothetical protein RHGRI_016160 [Rhododendron griersonianum]|uniref:Transposase MuDR plant domain-containing protein n=1 Tax=Rhododendron griersonianum TaxID=479676 RepID=A0AAV6JQ06_9ERIC|nr:hypothetical protein RHGRI_016160 [Rhododendron griersonianum]